LSNTFPDITWDRVKATGCSHHVEAVPRPSYGQPTLTMHANLVQKLPLVLDTRHVESPLGVAIGIADST
jgi:hypothetical protein